MIRTLLKEYIRELIAEMGPVAFDDTAGMITPTRPTTDPDDVESEFDREAFIDFTRRAYRTAVVQDATPDLDDLADEISSRQRKLTGVEIDMEDLESELEDVKKEEEDLQGSTPEEKNRYYADPKWYTKNT